jgi:hypothetical protein
MPALSPDLNSLHQYVMVKIMPKTLYGYVGLRLYGIKPFTAAIYECHHKLGYLLLTSFMLVSGVGAYPSGAPLRCSS